MPFDLATAREFAPDAGPKRGFDLATAKPAGGPDKSVPDSNPVGPNGQPIVSRETSPAPSFGDKVYGFADAANTAVTGAAGSLAGNVTALVNALRPSNYGTQEGAARATQAGAKVQEAIARKPSPQGQEALEDIGGFARTVGADKLAGMGPLAMPIAQRTAAAAKPAAAATGEGLATAGSKVKSAITPNIAPEIRPIAERAREMGITIPPDKLSDNKFLRLMGEASRQVPLSGSGVPENRIAFNKAIIKTIGGDPEATKISSKVFADAMNKSGSLIGDISARHPIPAQPFEAKLSEYLDSIKRETPQARAIAEGYVADLREAVKDGAIDGTAFRKLRTKITGQMRRTTDGDLKHALGGLDDAMLDTIQSQLTAEELSAFTDARRMYSNGKTLEPLVAKAAVKGSGDMSPAALANQVVGTKGAKSAVAKGKGGDLADIAQVGSRFLTEPGSSNTAERGAAYAALGGGGFLGGVPAAAGLYGGANAYNRLGPWITDMMLAKPPK